MLKMLVVLVLLLLANSSQALPPAFNAQYKISVKGMTIGNMTASLSYSGNQYKYYKSSKATGLASLFSGDKITDNVAGTFAGEVLQPAYYVFMHKSKRKDIQDNIRFQTATFVIEHYKKKSYKLEVPQGTLDRSSMELAFARDIASGKQQFSYSLIDSGKLKNYAFIDQGQEEISLPAGSYNCRKFQVKREGKSRKTTLWLAKETSYIPVKIEHVEKGTTIVTRLSTFKTSSP